MRATSIVFMTNLFSNVRLPFHWLRSLNNIYWCFVLCLYLTQFLLFSLFPLNSLEADSWLDCFNQWPYMNILVRKTWKVMNFVKKEKEKGK